MISKIPQDDWRKFATLRAFYSYQWAWPGKQLVFMGQEFGQRREFTEDEPLEWWVTGLWGHHGLQLLFRDMNCLYRTNRAFWRKDNEPGGFQWIVGDDSGANVFAWLRTDGQNRLVACLTNFSATPHVRYRIGLPQPGTWKESLNTNALRYDGTGDYANDTVTAIAKPHRDFPFHADIKVPALGSVWLQWQPEPADPDPSPCLTTKIP
jgi:1,4-alpha-glucan branching enzyme